LKCEIYLSKSNKVTQVVASNTINGTSTGAFDCTDMLITKSIDKNAEVHVIAKKDLVIF